MWQSYDPTIRTDVDEDELDPAAEVVTVLPLSPESVLVGVTDGGAPAPGLEC